MPLRFFCLLFICLLTTGIAVSQDLVTMLNGRSFDAKVIDTSIVEVKYERWKRGKLKQYEVDASKIFEIEFADGTSKILYKKDSMAGNFLSVAEMQFYILGEQDAYKYFKGGDAAITGFIIGISGGYLFADLFLVMLVPVIPPSVLALMPTNINPKKVPNPVYFKNENYRHGYTRVANQKKVLGALKGGLAGALTGFAAFYVAASLNR
ncbi:MAG: hypothetical protein H0X62_02100 [Bacteroidetes bacterium]|nr:hypothetical protein [Bacteroidota bacterium]